MINSSFFDAYDSVLNSPSDRLARRIHHSDYPSCYYYFVWSFGDSNSRSHLERIYTCCKTSIVNWGTWDYHQITTVENLTELEFLGPDLERLRVGEWDWGFGFAVPLWIVSHFYAVLTHGFTRVEAAERLDSIQKWQGIIQATFQVPHNNIGLPVIVDRIIQNLNFSLSVSSSEKEIFILDQRFFLPFCKSSRKLASLYYPQYRTHLVRPAMEVSTLMTLVRISILPIAILTGERCSELIDTIHRTPDSDIGNAKRVFC